MMRGRDGAIPTPANFASDNVTPASPEIMAALAAANAGPAMPYGGDSATKRLDGLFSDMFEREVAAFPVATGTAANVLALSTFVPPYGAVLCHADAHIHVDECGAPEFYTGAKLVPIAGEHGRIDVAGLRDCLASAGIGSEHHVQPAAISLTQATERGTVYQPATVADLGDLARSAGLAVHMDGARFANAVASLGCAPADLTWRAGVDVLSFGATKNGAMAAEAVIFFRPEDAATFRFRRKRGGHLLSKMRFLSAQLEAYVTDDLWLRNARNANAMARRLAEGLSRVPGCTLVHPVEANEVFPRLPEPVIVGLERQGFGFHRWGGAASSVLRLVTAFDTGTSDVDGLVEAAALLAPSSGAAGG
jgi:threonine aldolase